ncbi:intracellular proteinase inhibitor [Bacillus sp. BRMEA1]|uniref:intracellular proteinase inhibitor n=1 Tax=Neobacillus endophyticus TaxID=2738405 RepID=UPI00156791AE|nr:intracellular proteinase inhibitor [Neobacillus endophyticus]NRD78400.1 intracellular proteinase inhibitor [Neobacillus endophyticus]
MRILLCLILLIFPFFTNAMAKEAPLFHDIKVSGTNGNYVVTGESRMKTGKFLYSVEDGHVDLINESEVRTNGKGNSWKKFRLNIQILKEKLPKNGTVILNLYERGQDGKIKQIYPVVLQRFN